MSVFKFLFFCMSFLDQHIHPQYHSLIALNSTVQQISDVREVWQVCERIASSSKQVTTSTKVDQLLVNAQSVWDQILAASDGTLTKVRLHRLLLKLFIMVSSTMVRLLHYFYPPALDIHSMNFSLLSRSRSTLTHTYMYFTTSELAPSQNILHPPSHVATMDCIVKTITGW